MKDGRGWRCNEFRGQVPLELVPCFIICGVGVILASCSGAWVAGRLKDANCKECVQQVYWRQLRAVAMYVRRRAM